MIITALFALSPVKQLFHRATGGALAEVSRELSATTGLSC